MDYPSPYNVLSLCAGVGGLELGVEIARPGARCVAMVEREAAAAETLAARMEDGTFPPAPIWSNVATFNGREWRDVIHCVTSGDPCQPNSVAGPMLGERDDRWLLDHIIRIVDEVRPDRFFRENVCGRADNQVGYLIPALERLGYRIAVGIFSAAEVGFSHRRERLFIMADRADIGPQGLGAEHEATGRQEPGRSTGLCDGTDLVDAKRARRKKAGARSRIDAGAEPESRSGELGNAGRDGPRAERVDHGEGTKVATSEGENIGPALHRRAGGTVLGDVGDASSRNGSGARQPETPHTRTRRGKSGRPGVGAGLEMGNPDRSADERQATNPLGRSFFGTPVNGPSAATFEWLPLAAPGPADPRWRDIIAHAPHLEPAVRRVDARVADRIDRLRAAGNGVSSLAAAYAWSTLSATLRSAD